MTRTRWLAIPILAVLPLAACTTVEPAAVAPRDAVTAQADIDDSNVQIEALHMAWPQYRASVCAELAVMAGGRAAAIEDAIVIVETGYGSPLTLATRAELRSMLETC